MDHSISWQFEVLAQYPVLLEGPAWDGDGLLFTEIANNRIHRYDPNSGECSVYRDETNEANGLMFDSAGNLFACEGGGRRMVRYDPDNTVVLADTYDGKRLNSPNDLAIDDQGRIWFTDPRYGSRDGLELDHESVYRIEVDDDRDWSIKRMTFDTMRPNGLLISHDQGTLYVAESAYGEGNPRELRAYPILTDGTLGEFRVLHDFYPHRGIDGMCLDTAGNIIATAGWEESGPGPMIYVFSPTGDVLSTHRLPVDYPTNCTFGGDDLTTLYVTTGSGYLLRTRTGHQGRLWYPPLPGA
jgi:gluconolactonase